MPRILASWQGLEIVALQGFELKAASMIFSILADHPPNLRLSI